MKRAAHSLAATTLAVALALAPGLALAQPAAAQTTGTGQAGTMAAQPGMAQPGMAQPGMAQPGMAHPGMAQPGTTGAAAASGNDNQAVVTTPANAATPASGRNSFTRGEVSRRLAARGFTHASGLKKDTNGVWRGQAMHDGATTGVWVDYKGNVGTGDAQ